MKYIKGLKGICCVIVSLGHAVALLLPELHFGSVAKSHTEITAMIYELPINLFYNAPSALICFLILSGFVTPLKSFCQNEEISVLEKWIKKYMRLMPMALIGVMFGWIVMKLDMVYCYKMVDLSFSELYASKFNNFEVVGVFEPTGPIYEGVVRVFKANSPINSPLGTLKYIWQFSFVLYVFTKWVSKWKYRDIIYGICFVIFMTRGAIYQYDNYYYAAILLGMWICDGMFHPKRKRHLNSLTKRVTIGLLGVGVVLISIPAATPLDGIYKWTSSSSLSHTVYYIIGWSLVVIGISNSECLQKIFSWRPFLWLGDISFGYYTVHWPVIISFTCMLTLFLYNYLKISYVTSAFGAIIISIPIIAVIAWVVEKIVYKNLYNVEMYIYRKLIEK